MNKSILAVSIALIAGFAQADEVSIIDPSNVQDAMTIGRVAVNAEGVTQEQRDQVAYMIEAVGGYAGVQDQLAEKEQELLDLQNHFHTLFQGPLNIVEMDRVSNQIKDLESEIEAWNNLEVIIERTGMNAGVATVTAGDNQVTRNVSWTGESNGTVDTTAIRQDARAELCQELNGTYSNGSCTVEPVQADVTFAQVKDAVEVVFQSFENGSGRFDVNYTPTSTNMYRRVVTASELNPQPEPTPEPSEDTTYGGHIDGITDYVDNRTESTLSGMGIGEFVFNFFDVKGFSGTDHGYRVMQTAQTVYDVTVNQITGGLEFLFDGIMIRDGNKAQAIMTVNEDESLSIYASASTTNNMYESARLDYSDDAGNAFDSVNGIPVDRGAHKSADFLATQNQLNIISAQNSTIDAEGNAAYCDADLEGLEEKSVPLCGDFVHAVLASGKALDRTLVVGSVQNSSWGYETDGAIQNTNANVIFFEIPAGRTNSSSHGVGVAAAIAAMIVDNMAVEPTAVELKEKMFEIAQDTTVDRLLTLKNGAKTTEAVTAKVLSVAMVEAYFGI